MGSSYSGYDFAYTKYPKGKTLRLVYKAQSYLLRYLKDILCLILQQKSYCVVFRIV